MSEGGAGQTNGGTPPGPSTPARARFPALDPKPAARSASRQVVRAVVVVVVAAALAAGGFGLSHQLTTTAAGASHGGGALILTSSGQLALATPGQLKARPVPGLGSFGQIPPLPSADGRYLVGSDGTLFALSNRGVKVQRTAVRLTTSTQHPPFSDALADHDQAMVVISTPAVGTSAAGPHVGVAPLATGKLVDLGLADGEGVAAGDPQALGAFVAVPSPTAPTAGTSVNNGFPPDARVELRDVGKFPVVLGTAASLNGVLHLPANEPVALFPIPDATGDKIAITVSPVAGSSGPQTAAGEGVVIVDRTGRILATAPSTIGATLGAGVSWSPDGSQVAFAVTVAGTATAGVAVLTLTDQITSRIDPQNGAQPGGCFWSPDGATILCQVLEPGNVFGWDEAAAQGGIVSVLVAPGQFLAWLPAAGSR